VNWLGDAVMTTPAMLRLRERFPDAHIALLTPEKLRDLWLRHPAANEIISFKTGAGLFSIGRKLRSGNFALALVLPNSPRSALEVWLARIPRRVGISHPFRDWLLTDAIPPAPGLALMRKRSKAEIRGRIAADVPREDYPAGSHQTRHYLHLASALGASTAPLEPKLVVTEEERASFHQRFLADQPTSSSVRIWCGLQPGAEYGPAKRWPVEHFIAAAGEVAKRTGCHWLIFGGGDDASLAQQIEAGVHSATNLCGRTTLRELMAALALCRVLLTNDTGPMHVAAALGTPVIVPFGSTSPELTGPGLPGGVLHHMLKSDVPCSPCFRRVCPIDLRCMTSITVARVTKAVLRAFAPG
jgi:heptosyltransferase-2